MYFILSLLVMEIGKPTLLAADLVVDAQFVANQSFKRRAPRL
jgi:hypothetical protein